MKRILFVDDNKDYGLFMQKMLQGAGYGVDVAFDMFGGIEQFSKSQYDLVISDRVMGEGDGVRLLGVIKNMNGLVKSILLTAEPTPESEFEALNQYVDYYLSKDTAKPVLLKYVERVLEEPPRTVNKRQTLISETEQIKMDLNEHIVTVNGESVHLQRKDFELLALFLLHKNVVFSRHEILERIWEQNYEDIDERAVDVHVNTLRRKLHITSLVSIRGYGYKWDE